MTLIQDYCTALDKLNAAIRDVNDYLLDGHPASSLGPITVELPEAFSYWYANCESDPEAFWPWRLRFDHINPDLPSSKKAIILEFLDDTGDVPSWTNPDYLTDLPATWRVGVAPYLPLLLKRADELLELQTAELEQTVSGIYEALEVAKKNGLPTKSGKKRK